LHSEDLLRLVDLYTGVKSFILKAEELDARLESNIAVIKEQRDALDHVMRFIGRCLKNDFEESEKDQDYISLQIDKACGHLYRAGYDSLDGIIASVTVRIRDDYLREVPLESIRDVMPEYWSDYVPKLDEIKIKAGKHREQKDIGDSNGESFAAYQEIALDALRIDNAIRDKRAALQDHIKKAEEDANTRQKKEWKERYLIPAGTAILGAVAGWLLVVLFG
jgi:hypothetical protein